MSEAKVHEVKTVKDGTPTATESKSVDKDNDEAVSNDDAAVDRMDELTSLEREIAQMHQPTAPVVAQRVDVDAGGDVDDGIHGDKVLLEMQPASRNSTPGSQNETTGGSALETPIAVESCDDDLIAVLKGLDRGSEEEDKEMAEQHQNHALLDAALVEGVTIEGEGEFQIMEIVDDEADDVTVPVVSDTKAHIHEVYRTGSTSANKSNIKLTREEERAMAMEQMAGLRVDHQKRRRKQDMKPLKAAADMTDLVSTINAEWSEDDMPMTEQNSKTISATSRSSSPNELRLYSSPTKHTNGRVKITNAEKTIKMDDSSSATDNIAEASTNTGTNQQISGFKRTRIIKRKIIWDPDAPETRISYSQLVRGTNKIKTESAQPSNTTHAVRKTRPVTPKDQTVQISSNNTATDSSSSPTKRRSQTPIANGANAGSAKKKKNSEVDRLMSDEGAVNMLNSLESERIKLEAELEDDKPHRPLMRSRAATISERFTKREPSLPTVTLKKEPTPVVTKNKRGPKQKPSATWDYVYKQQASEDAMIIRRRSNSSYSSTASQHRLSLDAPITPKTTPNKSANCATATPAEPNSNSTSDETIPVIAAKTTSKSKISSKPNTENMPIAGKTFEFAKPKSKTNQKSNRRSKSIAETPATTSSASNQEIKKTSHASANKARSATRSPATIQEKQEKSNKSPITIKDALPIADVTIKKVAKVSQIIFNTQKAKLSYTFTAQLMNKLVEALDKLSNDSDCHAVVMITNAPHFCQGLDFNDLVVGTSEERKTAAIQLATAAKNYIKTLATFPKPLIAGVNGANIGLGVTQLPLFDIVVASDKSSYETPYARIGQVPEGYCIWNNLTKIRGTLKTKLFWLCEKLHSSESALCGLVNKIATTNRVNDDAILIAKKIAASSAETYRVMKSHTIKSHLDAIITSLDDEFDTIAKQWTSSECLEHFKKFLELGHF